MSESSQSSMEKAAEEAILHQLHLHEGEDADAMTHCHHCPLGQAVLQSLDLAETVANLTAAMHPPVAPPADLKETIMSQIAEEPVSSDSETSGFQYTAESDGEWKFLPGGKIRLKTLSDNPESGHTTVLLEAQPGAVFFPHAHKGTEEVFLINGDLTTSEHKLTAGDHLLSTPGTRHSKAVSEHGCRALLITAHENHPKKAISLYNTLTGLLSPKKKTPLQ